MRQMLCGLILNFSFLGAMSIADSESKWITHKLQSPHQRGETSVHVLLPADFDDAKQYCVLYVLPVEAGDGKRWGNALAEVQKLRLATKHQLICAYPTFSDLPWYADHPTDEKLQQETYFLKDVLPLVEREYPALATREGRLLVGFSKSGWGAWSLLLRQPEMFAAAAAWDAPLMETSPNKYGMGPIFGSEENFQGYRIDELLTSRAKQLQGDPRLVLTGYDSFRKHSQKTHEFLTKLEPLKPVPNRKLLAATGRR